VLSTEASPAIGSLPQNSLRPESFLDASGEPAERICPTSHDAELLAGWPFSQSEINKLTVILKRPS